MKIFRVDRTDKIDWCEDYCMVVIAKDQLHAERRARWESEDFKNAKLKVVEIQLDEEKLILKANTGA